MTKFSNEFQWECGRCGHHSDIRETYIKNEDMQVATGIWIRELHKCDTCNHKQFVVVEYQRDEELDNTYFSRIIRDDE